jgi:hypothetical protein
VVVNAPICVVEKLLSAVVLSPPSCRAVSALACVVLKPWMSVEDSAPIWAVESSETSIVVRPAS